MTAAGQPNRPADHTSPLPSSVIGRGTDAITADEVDALYPVTFEDTLMAALDEQARGAR